MFGSLGSRNAKGGRYRGDGTISISHAIAENNARLRPGTIRVTLDEDIPDNAVEFDGSTITDGAKDNPACAARYPWMVSGDDLVLPDARGRVWRAMDDGSGNAPDAASRNARSGDGQTGDYPGTTEEGRIEAHLHTMTANDGIDKWAAGEGVRSSNANRTGAYTGGNETRPKNVYVSCWMVLG